MGNLLRVLNDKGGSVPKVNLFVDFEKAQPTDAEKAVYEKVAAVLERAPRIIDELGGYTGAGEQIREAISKPSNEDTQEKAWNAVRPLVLQLKTYYEFCTELETALTSILSVLCSADMTAMSHLEMHQALTKQLAEILDFSLKFDDLKMNNPSIQNDFSYYRRTMSRKRLESNDQPRTTGAASNSVEGEVDMRDDVANRMSLFYAHPTPLLNALSATTKRFVEMHSELPLENTTDCLSMVACVCRVMTENPNYYTRFENEETIYFCLRVMVGVIILYDHVHPVGAFAKNAPIDIHKSVKVLKDHSQKTDGLLNALRFNTKHFNDEQTPKATKTLLSS
ncbi:CYFIP-related Rac1 interactor B-like [Dysidea avara]|uniref:CYFIP-related Rac1 interactor B-like n=1 Tax=Dysidea avara TaxID=196820 RepID=UPI0033316BAE